MSKIVRAADTVSCACYVDANGLSEHTEGTLVLPPFEGSNGDAFLLHLGILQA